MTSRALRFGVVIRDSLVEERVLTGPVTFGQSLRCTLSVPVDGVPREHALITVDQGRYLLHVPAGMEGRLGRSGAEAITMLGGEARTIPIERGTRGKLRLGDATILFQEVAAAPPTPRPQLPASVRGTLADRVDGRLAAIIGISLLAHVGIAVWAWMGDVDQGDLLAPREVAAYHQDTIDVTLPDLTPKPPEQAPGVASPLPQQVPHPFAPPHHIAVVHPPPVPGHDDATRLAAILTSSETGPTGPAGMSHRQPGADLSQQLDDARTRKITIGDDGHTSRFDDQARLGTDPGPDLETHGPTFTQLPQHRQETTHPRFQIGPIHADDPTTLTPDAVLAKIQSLYLPGLQHCYTLGLRGDSTLAGKVAIGFTVSDTGKVIDPEASGVGGGVDTCIQKQMSGWRFAIPRVHGEAADASFHVSLALQPD